MLHDLGKRLALEQAASDGEHYYLLCYKLNRKGLKPGFQKLTVKTTRKVGRLHARSGFYVAEAGGVVP